MALKLNQLRMFVAVAEHGSFSAAAAELDCTQSRISHAIAELERELALRLLDRSHGGSVPTEAGRRVLEKARGMLHLEQDLRASAGADGARALSGQVRVACFRSIGTHLLPYAAEALAAACPGVVLEIDDGYLGRDALLEALRERRADIAVAQLPLGRGLAGLPWLHDDYVLVLPAGRPVLQPFSWRQLEGLPMIQLACPGADEVLERCRAAGLAVRAQHRLANDTSIAAMVARGMGFSIMPRLAVFPEPEGVHILALPIPARRSFALAGDAAAMRRPEVAAVLKILRSRKMVERTKAWQAGVLAWD
jgi:DNA-binding transcriptional LysR family regulator